MLERYHLDFTRAGAAAAPEAKARLAAIAERLATLARSVRPECARGRKRLAAAAGRRPISMACRIFSSPAPRASPPTAAIRASTRSPCRDRASSRSCNSRPAAICARTPFAPGRRAAKTAAPTDNRAIAAEMVRLRAERARLLGYETYAHYRLADTMAKTPQAALDLLEFGLGAGRGQRAQGRRGAAGDCRGRGRQFQARALGLALFTRRSGARPSSTSTRARSSPICSSTA